MTNLLVIAEEQAWRADTYSLLANLLQAPPEKSVLERLKTLRFEESDSSEQPLIQTWKDLSASARNTKPESIRLEYHDLFIGMTRGEIVPYASFYLTGFLMEKPLAGIRNDLAAAGIQRLAHVREPEDHIAALFEVMTLLIRRNDERQDNFFQRHIFSWAPRLFRDIANARHAVFYEAVANLASEFMTLERQLIEFDEHHSTSL
jgi:TorA maturation chaperone TorD